MTKEEFDNYINEINKSLSPCPFCGGKAKFDCSLEVDPVIDENGAYIDADVWYWECITCTECGAKIELDEEEPEETTVRKWNSRKMISVGKITNADRIRNMTEEELAEFLEITCGCSVCFLDVTAGECKGFRSSMDCIVNKLKWLKQEVTQDDKR